jgi:aspartate/methionine/tyrosine aminotransferase
MSDTLSRPIADRVGKLEFPQFVPVDVDVPQSAQNGAIQALADGKTHYTNRPGIVPLREWVAQNLNTEYKLGIDKDEVTITCGVEEAIFACVMVLAENSIFTVNDTSRLKGASTLKDVPLRHSIDELNDGTLIYLANNDPQDTVDAILENANAETCWIMWDTTVSESDFHPAQNEKWASRTIMIGSTEDVLTGWRIGWMAGSLMAGKIRGFKQSMTICSPSISQWAVYGWASGE